MFAAALLSAAPGCTERTSTRDRNVLFCTDTAGLPTVEFKINGTWLSLHKEDYVLENKITFMPASSVLPGLAAPGDVFILGDAFLQAFYTVFDQGQARAGFDRTPAAGYIS